MNGQPTVWPTTLVGVDNWETLNRETYAGTLGLLGTRITNKWYGPWFDHD
jgi:hypothetical protein